MTIPVSDEQLVGSLLPEPYVKTVTLETSATSPPRVENPHIQHEWENKPLTKSSSKTLKVGLDLIIKEKLGTSNIESFFQNEDFSKYLRIKIIQCTSPELTEVLSVGRNVLEIINTNSTEVIANLILENINQSPGAFELTKELLEQEIDLVEHLNSQFEAHIKEAKIGLGFGEMDPSLLGSEISITDNGSKIIDHTYRVKFDIADEDPYHLSYFVMTSVDIDQIIEDYNLNPELATTFLNTINGKTTLERVIDGGKLISKAFIFRDKDGLIWTGPAHMSSGAWYTGTEDSDDSLKRLLLREEITNSKIQDFRIHDRLRKLSLDLSIVKNKIFNKNLPWKLLTNDNMDIPHPQTYFSAAAFNRDSSGTCSFTFGVDFGKIVKENAKFGQITSPDSCRIRNLSVLRRRVRKFPAVNQLGSERIEIFDKNEPVEVVARGSEKVSGQLVFSAPMGTAKESNYYQDAALTPEHSRFIEVTDLQMGVVTDGHYQYGVEIEIEDKSEEKIVTKIYNLVTAKKLLDRYYSIATIPYDPRKNKGNFDTVSNRFTNSFIEEFETGGDVAAMITQSYSLYTDTLLFFQYYLQKQGGGLIADWSTLASLYWFLVPTTATPRSIKMVIGLVESLTQHLSRLTALSPAHDTVEKGLTPDSDGNYIKPSVISTPGKAPPKSFKIEYYFSEIFDSDLPKNVGYDYLGAALIGDSGIKEIPLSGYKQRVNQEVMKYYNSLAGELNLEDAIMTYLSPVKVDLGQNEMADMTSDPFDPEKNLKIQGIIQNMNLERKSPFLPMIKSNLSVNAINGLTPSQNQIKSNFIGMMEALNVTIDFGIGMSPIDLPLINPADMEKDPFTDAGDIMGEEYESVDQPTISPQKETGVIANNILGSLIDPTMLFSDLLLPQMLTGAGSYSFFSGGSQMQFPDLSSWKHLTKTFNPSYYNFETIAKTLQTTVDDERLVKIPNQIRSLFHNENPAVRYNWGSGDSPELNKTAFIMNYKSIRKVEAFIGFESDDNGDPIMKKPIWKELNEDLMKRTTGKLLCRHVRYHNAVVGMTEATGLRMPVYDKYFVITGTESLNVPKIVKTNTERIAAFVKNIQKQHKNIRAELVSTGLVTGTRMKPNSVRKKKNLEKIDLKTRKRAN